MSTVFTDLNDLQILLETNSNSKKQFLMRKMHNDLERILNKYEYMYNKYIIKNKKINNIKNEKEKSIAIVQNSIEVFFPYILAYNIAQISDES